MSSFFKRLRSPTSPVVSCERPSTILSNAGAALTLTTTDQASDVVDVEDAREIVVLVQFTPGAAGSFYQLRFLLSAEDAPTPTSTRAPAVGDDVWYAPAVYDGSVIASVPAGSLVAGADYTNDPEWGVVTMRPLIVYSELGNNATDKIRQAYVVKCGWAKYFHMVASDQSAGTKGAILVKAARVL